MRANVTLKLRVSASRKIVLRTRKPGVSCGDAGRGPISTCTGLRAPRPSPCAERFTNDAERLYVHIKEALYARAAFGADAGWKATLQQLVPSMWDEEENRKTLAQTRTRTQRSAQKNDRETRRRSQTDAKEETQNADAVDDDSLTVGTMSDEALSVDVNAKNMITQLTQMNAISNDKLAGYVSSRMVIRGVLSGRV
eukprot:scaffold2214_cov128-Isochrysis_galbana.AAC.8